MCGCRKANLATVSPSHADGGMNATWSRCSWSAQYTDWADQLHRDQVAFIPPSAWEGETVARFAFLHPHTPMDLVRQILDRME